MPQVVESVGLFEVISEFFSTFLCFLPQSLSHWVFLSGGHSLLLLIELSWISMLQFSKWVCIYCVLILLSLFGNLLLQVLHIFPESLISHHNTNALLVSNIQNNNNNKTHFLPTLSKVSVLCSPIFSYKGHFLDGLMVVSQIYISPLRWWLFSLPLGFSLVNLGIEN